MTSRTTRSFVTFAFPFVIAGYSDELPAGKYEILVEEDLIEGPSFMAYRRTSTQILIDGQIGVGRMEIRPTDVEDLELALSLDKERSTKVKSSEAAHSPQEDLA